jgi:hypothetical protein
MNADRRLPFAALSINDEDAVARTAFVSPNDERNGRQNDDCQQDSTAGNDGVKKIGHRILGEMEIIFRVGSVHHRQRLIQKVRHKKRNFDRRFFRCDRVILLIQKSDKTFALCAAVGGRMSCGSLWTNSPRGCETRKSGTPQDRRASCR